MPDWHKIQHISMPNWHKQHPPPAIMPDWHKTQHISMPNWHKQHPPASKQADRRHEHQLVGADAFYVLALPIHLLCLFTYSAYLFVLLFDIVAPVSKRETRRAHTVSIKTLCGTPGFLGSNDRNNWTS